MFCYGGVFCLHICMHTMSEVVNNRVDGRIRTQVVQDQQVPLTTESCLQPLRRISLPSQDQ